MKNLFYLAGLGLLLTACGGESTPTTTADTTHVDTTAALPLNTPIDGALLAKFNVSTALPFEQDTAYLYDRNYDDSVALTSADVKYLTFGFVETTISYQGLMPVENFLDFDSMKTAGTYEDYVESGDIGMTLYAEAFVAQKIVMDDSTTLLLWIVDHSTYEACPYGAGKVLYASVLRNNAVTSCTIIGEDDAGSDPPVWGETLSLVSISSEAISVFKHSRNCQGEVDEDEEEIVNEEMLDYMLDIDANGVWMEVPLVLAE